MAEATTKERIFHICEVLFQQILAVFVLLILWELFKSNTYGVNLERTWHIILSVLGIALCMAEGVQIYRKQSIVSFGSTREDKKKAHLFVMLFAFICITIGIALKISEKANASRSHFVSTHAKLGLATWVISFVAVLGGAYAYITKSSRLISPSVVKIIHILLGLSAYIIGVATLIYGLEYLLGANSRGWIALTVILIIYVAYSLIEPCVSLFKYITGK